MLSPTLFPGQDLIWEALGNWHSCADTPTCVSMGVATLMQLRGNEITSNYDIFHGKGAGFSLIATKSLLLSG